MANSFEVFEPTLISGFASPPESLHFPHSKETILLQKLFSAFPSGWPGVGLLLLRALVAATLISQTLTYVGSANLNVLSICLAVLAFVIAACFLLGLMTPIIAIVIGLSTIALAGSSVFQLTQPVLNLIVLTTAIGLLGPGAFSLDARMFGRREILIRNAPRPTKS